MIDPINTTALDGAACALCGEDANGIDVIDHRPIPTCANCHHDSTFACIECGLLFLSETGYRLSNEPGMFCLSCAHTHPELIIGRERESRADVARDDDFEQERR